LPLSKKMHAARLAERNLGCGIRRHALWGKNERTMHYSLRNFVVAAWRLAVVAFVAAALGYTSAKAGTEVKAVV